MWMLRYQPAKSWGIELSGKYVGDQYLDNTSNDGRKLDAYYTQDIKLDYETSFGFVKSLKAFVQVQNVFSTLYEPNGYTFSYQYNQQLTTENYYFPMAPAQFFAGLLLNF
jgi:iron complex outermembrane receptor protein